MEKAIRIPRAHWLTQIGLPIVFLVIVSAIIGNIIGESAFRIVLAIILLAASCLHVMLCFRMKNAVYLVPMLFYLFAALTLITASGGEEPAALVLAGFALLLFLVMMNLLRTGKLKWRYREVMELAARSVTSMEDGFTPRPLAAGSVDADPAELRLFARFLLKHGIAYPYDEGHRLVFVVSGSLFSRLLGVKSSYAGETWVAFGPGGEVSVNIARQDYEKYTDKLTFDQLCESFGSLFADFYLRYRQGREKEILQTMAELTFVV